MADLHQKPDITLEKNVTGFTWNQTPHSFQPIIYSVHFKSIKKYNILKNRFIIKINYIYIYMNNYIFFSGEIECLGKCIIYKNKYGLVLLK